MPDAKLQSPDASLETYLSHDAARELLQQHLCHRSHPPAQMDVDQAFRAMA